MKRLAIISSHPIQYNAPLFALLAERQAIDIKVFYTWGEAVLKDKFDPGFGKVIEWDIPLLKGYQYSFLENVATDKGSHHFNGIDNPAIIETVEAFRPDAVLIFGWSFKSHLKAMRYFKGKIPVLFRGDSTIIDNTGFVATLKRVLFLNWLYRYVDTALYVGKSNRDYFKKFGLKDRQLVFAPHAIDNNRFVCDDTVCREHAMSYRKTLDIKDNDLVFLFVGKFESKKDPQLLTSAFINAGFPGDVHLVFVGNGELEAALKNQKANFSTIHFLDFQNQLSMPAVYQMANVLVLPSQGPNETWGLAVNEAMANGKAVVVSNKCGCARDLVADGNNGYVFEAGNQAALQALLVKMVARKADLPAMGTASRQLIDRYSYTALAEAIESLVHQ